MRRFLVFFLLCIPLLSLSAEEVSFSGESSLSLSLMLPESANAPLGNLQFAPEVTFSLETDIMSLWSSLELSDSGYLLDIERLYLQWYLTDHLLAAVGRQSFLTGYGYGWNPFDLVTEEQNPRDRKADRKGIDAVSLLYDDWNRFTGKLSLSANSENSQDFLTQGFFSLGEAAVSGEGTLLLPQAEIRGALRLDADDLQLQAAAAAYIDLAGFGVYGELNTDLDLLTGIEYYFPSGMSLMLEYFFHESGRNLEERKLFFAEGDYSLLTPGYFARHYLLGNMNYQFYGLNMEAGASILFSPDSLALTVTPGLSLHLANGISIETHYSGIFSLAEGFYNEAELIPAEHLIELSCSYAF